MARHGKDWFRLDNAAKIYPSITSTRVSTVFRISATLYKKVEPNILQEALDSIIERFPYYKVNLKRGIFWYYFDYTIKKPEIKKETYYPCMFMFFKRKNRYPFRVLYYKKRISIEISHIITDGTGATTFLKSLLAEYFRLLGFEVERCEDIFTADQEVDQEEMEDAFHKYYDKKIPNPPRLKKAFHFPFKFNKKGEYNIITGIISSKALLSTSKKYHATLTQFLLAVYIDSIQEFIKTYDLKRYRPIVLNVPVNLRKIYPSKTMRNFFISITPEIDFRLGDYSLEEIIKLVQNYMQRMLNRKYLNQYIHRNVKNEKTVLLRLVPLGIKNIFMPIIYNRFGERNYTSSISNIGKITMPKPIDEQIERFEFYPPPSEGNIIKIGMASYKDNVYISFGSLTKTTEIEKLFFRRIRKMGIDVKIETNRE